MITWQDPIAIALAGLLVALSLLWRRALIRRGTAPHCTQCSSGDAAAPKAKPTLVVLERMRLGRRSALSSRPPSH